VFFICLIYFAIHRNYHLTKFSLPIILDQGVQSVGRHRWPNGSIGSYRVAKKIRNTHFPFLRLPATPAYIYAVPLRHDRTVLACCIATVGPWRAPPRLSPPRPPGRHSSSPLRQVWPPAFIAPHHAFSLLRPSTTYPPLRRSLLSPTRRAHPPLLVGPLPPAHVGARHRL
jgi:hypothetical protein